MTSKKKERDDMGKGEGGGNRGGVTETEMEKRSQTNEEQRPNEFREENKVFPKSSLNLVR